MNNPMRRRLFLFFGLFFAIVMTDWLKFVYIGEPSIINWHSFVHPAWVLGACAVLLFAILVPAARVWNGLCLIYCAIFMASLVNQYIPFTPILTYNCMLFNAICAVVYFLAVPPPSLVE